MFDVCRDSRDKVLKDAFADCPNSLQIYQICTSHAFDVMAGDIKYHQRCWWNIIDHRLPVIPTCAGSIASTSFEQNQIVQPDFEVTFENPENLEYFDEKLPILSEETAQKQIELRGRRSIKVPTLIKAEIPDDFVKASILSEILEELKIELICGHTITLNNLVDIYRSKMSDQKRVDGLTDKALQIELSRLVNTLEGVILEKDFSRNKCQKTYTKDSKAFAL